jgi:hypothetical protein
VFGENIFLLASLNLLNCVLGLKISALTPACDNAFPIICHAFINQNVVIVHTINSEAKPVKNSQDFICHVKKSSTSVGLSYFIV